MFMQKKYITKSGAERLRAEYNELFRKERPKVVETVAWAASNGDRSENADYIYGKKRLREIDRRIQIISDFLDEATVVDPAEIKGDRVAFGATVVVETEEGEEKCYRIVSEIEMDTSKGDISYLSPVGRKLLGSSVGDTVVVNTPKGEKEYTILEIAFQD